MLVTFYVEAGRVDDVREYLEGNGIFVRNVGDDYIEAHVSPSQLGAASEQPGVLRVDTVVPALPPIPTSSNLANPAVISEGVNIHGADAWHGAGFRGENVKVGVIDSGFEGFARLQGTQLPGSVVARCYFATARAPSSVLADCEVDGNHGTTVAETLVDVAPNVTLYIANPITAGDLQSAANWMTGQGVTVINHSLDWLPLNPGDGTAPFNNAPLKTVDLAVAGGASFITAGGNNARRVWHGTFVDPDGDRWHNFDDQVEANHFTITESKKVSAFVRWDGDWGREDCDLDLALFRDDASTPTVIAIAEDFQDGGANRRPAEYVEVNVPPGVYSLSLWNARCATMPAWFQLFLWDTEGGSEELLYHSPGHHMAEPAEGRNPGMMAVGATHWWDTQQIAEYSSRGPTIDGRVKPDITGITCNPTVANPPVTLPDGSALYPTCGTSHSAPHITGLVALVKQRFPHYTPDGIVAYLEQNALDRGAVGADDIWGHGLATLPDPSAGSAPTTVGTIVDVMLTVGQMSKMDVSMYFSDADGDMLTYTAGSSDGMIATATIFGSMLTIEGKMAGTATIMVTATDAADSGMSATQDIMVTVASAMPNRPIINNVSSLQNSITVTWNPASIVGAEVIKVALFDLDDNGDIFRLAMGYDGNVHSINPAVGDPGTHTFTNVPDGTYKVAVANYANETHRIIVSGAVTVSAP